MRDLIGFHFPLSPRYMASLLSSIACLGPQIPFSRFREGRREALGERAVYPSAA